ncbi:MULTISPECIES: DUF4097 family beta strand repeat-containing protein [unclassified Paenibacillus]|uniref:DUF4097 family beta strand repeat-containing protein n=1 Tax=unclassified Paenibacillus TaxID=185978 RepID=UPI0036D2F0F0
MRRVRQLVGGILVIVGIIGVTYVINADEGTPYETVKNLVSKKIYEEQSYDLDDIKRIAIYDKSLDIILSRGSSDQAVVRMEGTVSKTVKDNYKLENKREGDTLHIGSTSRNGWFLGWSSVKINIELPERQWEEVAVSTVSGNITADQLEAGTLSLKTTSGSIHAKVLEATELTAKTISGNIKLEEAVSRSTNLKSTSGNVSIEQFKADQLTLITTSGNIKALEGNAEYEAETSSGNILIEAEHLLEDANLKTKSGNVTVELDQDPESLAVDFKAGSGYGKIRKSGFSFEDKDEDGDRLIGAFGSGKTELYVRTGSGNFTLK